MVKTNTVDSHNLSVDDDLNGNEISTFLVRESKAGGFLSSSVLSVGE